MILIIWPLKATVVQPAKVQATVATIGWIDWITSIQDQ
jgi:hypothetical protein